MLKQTITFTGPFDDAPRTEDLYFNITKAELSQQLNLIPRLESIGKAFEGEARALTVPEITELLALVRLFIDLSYGVRIGSGFRKSSEVLQDFKDSGAYDEFVFSLFEVPEKMFPFLTGVMPKDLREQATETVRQNNPELLSAVDGVQAAAQDAPVEDNRPAWIREGREPTNVELQTMSMEELQAAFAAKAANRT